MDYSINAPNQRRKTSPLQTIQEQTKGKEIFCVCEKSNWKTKAHTLRCRGNGRLEKWHSNSRST